MEKKVVKNLENSAPFMVVVFTFSKLHPCKAESILRGVKIATYAKDPRRGMIYQFDALECAGRDFISHQAEPKSLITTISYYYEGTAFLKEKVAAVTRDMDLVLEAFTTVLEAFDQA